MSILKVARMGHPVLRDKARTVDKAELKNPVVQQFIDSMIDTMYEYAGVGPAAPQVHESLRVFVAMLDPDAPVDATATPQPVVARLAPAASVHLNDATFPRSTRPDSVPRVIVGLPVAHRRDLP